MEVKAKFVGGPFHGKKMILPELQNVVMIMESPTRVAWGEPIDFESLRHEYRLTNVEYKGVRYYKHWKLDAKKSKTLLKAFNLSLLRDWYELRGQ